MQLHFHANILFFIYCSFYSITFSCKHIIPNIVVFMQLHFHANPEKVVFMQ